MQSETNLKKKRKKKQNHYFKSCSLSSESDANITLFIVLSWSSDILYIKYLWINSFHFFFWFPSFDALQSKPPEYILLDLYPVWIKYIFLNVKWSLKHIMRKKSNSKHMVHNIKENERSYRLLWIGHNILHIALGEWSKTCRYCEGRAAAANIAKQV